MWPVSKTDELLSRKMIEYVVSIIQYAAVLSTNGEA